MATAPAVDPQFAQWLSAESLWAVRQDAVTQAKWGDLASSSERATTLANRSDAEAEAQRQLAFLEGPLVKDTVELQGKWVQRIGRVITLTCDDDSYPASVDVFVAGASDDHSTGLSKVTVLRRL
ncbi:hypothetical protein D2V17_14175 [Aurantiacibacter xanthus]|uniref:Uncharacterized protein n=1 Tax=Aurantiacibacter xanthus TaxID=1784712 RepID=A0A3A1P3S3_9SPHN|nr:hypothetical protein [Aurantiacibacter xanthus]RIV82945.1 hypothetical protein D2V17_14175 [Aurantiacibacter xanthus]